MKKNRNKGVYDKRIEEEKHSFKKKMSSIKSMEHKETDLINKLH